ncbi:MAG: hypothetical protein R3D86_01865 [Emcibacteraceae bacterium]
MSIKKLMTGVAFGVMMTSQIANADEPYQDVAYKILKDSISMRTVVGEGNETPKFAAYLADLFKKAGFSDGDITIIPYEDTAGMIVRFRGMTVLAKNHSLSQRIWMWSKHFARTGNVIPSP